MGGEWSTTALRRGLAPYAVHNTFQYGGTPGKRHRMREANAWLGDEEIGYFDHPGGFLSYTPQIPTSVDLKIFSERSHPAARDDTFPPIETTSDAIVEAHAKLVKFQLQAGTTMNYRFFFHRFISL